MNQSSYSCVEPAQTCLPVELARLQREHLHKLQGSSLTDCGIRIASGKAELMAPSATAARRNLIVLLLGAMVLVTFVFWPIAGALFLGAVLGGVLWPLQLRLTKRLQGSRKLSAGALVLATAILVAAPVVAMSIVIGKQAAEVATFVSTTFQRSGVEGLLRHLRNL